MLIVGLTGSIGMGKSTAAGRLRDLGIAVFDADAEVHRLYNGPLATEIEAEFPGSTVDGRVDRGKLSNQLLQDPKRFRLLEKIVHPAVRAAEQHFLRAQHERGAEIAVLEIPLLLESGADTLVDVVVVVSASAPVQNARVLERPGMSPEKLAAVLARQLPDEEKRKRADFVVDTSGSIAACHSQIDAIVATLRGKQGFAYDRSWSIKGEARDARSHTRHRDDRT